MEGSAQMDDMELTACSEVPQKFSPRASLFEVVDPATRVRFCTLTDSEVASSVCEMATEI